MIEAAQAFDAPDGKTEHDSSQNNDDHVNPGLPAM